MRPGPACFAACSRERNHEMIWKVAKMYGGYVGEVFRESGGGEWFLDEEIMPGLAIPGLQKEKPIAFGRPRRSESG